LHSHNTSKFSNLLFPGQLTNPQSKMREKRSILIINPNSTESMTKGLEPLVTSLEFKDVHQRLQETITTAN
jgi:hypothetical protein